MHEPQKKLIGKKITKILKEELINHPNKETNTTSEPFNDY